MANVGRFTDRSPSVKWAGRSEFDRTLTAAGTFSAAEESNIPPIVSRHLEFVHPQPGVRTHYFNDPDIAPGTVFGKVATHHDPDNVSTLLAPPQRSKFREVVDNANFTTAVGGSSVVAPLGVGRNVKVRQPAPPVPGDTMFGIKNKFVGSAAECLHPGANEAAGGVKAMYTFSHGSFEPAEQRSRKYGGNFADNTRFGKPTPHYKDGKAVKTTLHWVFDSKAAQTTPLISKRARDFGDKHGGVDYHSALGCPMEPMKDTRALETMDPGHTYGSRPAPRTDGVAELMTQPDADEGRPEFMQTRDPLRETAPFYDGIDVSSYEGIDGLEQALVDKDIELNEVATGLLPRGLVAELLAAHGAPLSLDDLPATGDAVQYHNLVASLRSGQVRASPVKNLDPRDNVPFAGHPTLRLDLPAQELKSVSDRTNYGDQGTVATVLAPSNLTVRGLDEKDLMLPRSVDQIRAIFDAAGLGTTHRFEDVWNRARDQAGLVSVLSFQNAIDG